MPETRMEELDDTECRRLLAERHLGRLAIPDFGGPVIFPVNYVFDQDLVIFRTDPGSKLDAAMERRRSPSRSTRSRRRPGPAGAWSSAALWRTSPTPPIWSGSVPCPCTPGPRGRRARYVRVRPFSVTGRRIKIPDGLPFTWWG